jgi:hypothetical protein
LPFSSFKYSPEPFARPNQETTPALFSRVRRLVQTFRPIITGTNISFLPILVYFTAVIKTERYLEAAFLSAAKKN